MVSRATIQELLERGSAAWPGVTVSAQTLALHLGRLAAEDGRSASERAAHSGDLYLACACATGDARALSLFDTHLLSRVDVFVARIDASPQFGELVRHELRDRLLTAAPGTLPRIARYSARGPLGAWVRMAAVRLAIDLKRANNPVLLADRLPDVGDTKNPEVQLIKSRYAAEYQRALAQAWQTVSVRERTVLRLHYVAGRTIDEIGASYQVHRATAARWIVSAREHVLDEMLRLLSARLQLTKAEFHSIARLVGKLLHVSLGAVPIAG
jgi:RNA polymerase sigma-70 factor (ECF subfamily)